MITRKLIFLLGITFSIILVGSGFKSKDVKQFGSLKAFHVAESEELHYTVAEPIVNTTEKIQIPFTGKSYIGFKQAVAIKESLGLYTLVNTYGYMGKYQFGKSALKAIGITNTTKFLNNPKLQERAFKALLGINKWELRREIQKYEGSIINGVKITESGLLAAAHLAGASSVKRFLRSNGKHRFRDGFGTSLKSYIKKFGGYDTSLIIPNRSPKIMLN